MTVKVVSLSWELAAMRLETNCCWQPKNSSIVSQGKRKNAAGGVNVCVFNSAKKGLKTLSSPTLRGKPQGRRFSGFRHL